MNLSTSGWHKILSTAAAAAAAAAAAQKINLSVSSAPHPLETAHEIEHPCETTQQRNNYL